MRWMRHHEQVFNKSKKNRHFDDASKIRSTVSYKKPIRELLENLSNNALIQN